MDTTKARRKNDGLLCYNHGMESKQHNKFSLKELLKNSFRITQILWQEQKLLIIGTGITILFSALLPFIRSWLSGQLINNLIKLIGTHSANESLWLLIGGIITISIASTSINTFQSYQAILLRHYIEEKFDLLILKKRTEIDVASYENPKLHDLFQSVRDDGWWRIHGQAERQFYLLENIIEVFIASLIISSKAWWLLPLVVLGALPELVAETKNGDRTWSINSSNAEDRRRYWQLKEHFTFLPNLIEVKLLGLAKNFLERISLLYQNFRSKEKRNERKRLLWNLCTSSINQLAMAMAIIYFAVQVINGHLDIGNFSFLLASIASLQSSFSSTFRNLARQYEDNLFITDVFRLLDLKPELTHTKKPLLVKTKSSPSIHFKNVSFKYPGKDAWVLKNINLEIRPGEKVAMVGINGAGKTTLVKLLCRFYDPVDGQILIDGKDLKEIEKESWYRSLGILFQDYATYNFKIKDAIAIGKITEKENLNKIRLAAEQSEAMKFIEEFPDKLNQQLGREFPGGTEPSQGQWQKLALARIFYRNANVWILDEPTASIDAESEAKIFEKLEKLPKDKTVILISHRFSTVRNADKIIVLKDGTISEQGTHTELLKNKQDYARLFHMQAKGYE